MKQLTEQEKIEMLLKPRYKVIAGYPQSSFKVNDIWPDCSPEWITEEQKEFTLTEMASYPHLFRKLEWWEERNPKDIEAVKYVKDRGWRVYEILTWVIDGDVINAGITERPFIIHVPHLTPATLEEYNTYLSKQD